VQQLVLNNPQEAIDSIVALQSIDLYRSVRTPFRKRLE
jgi:hypothetical protein